MMLLTVGTSFPFDRFVQAMDRAVGQGEITEKIFAQVGEGGYKPQHFDSVETLNKKEFDSYFSKADAIIAHAGMGTITMALELDKPILVIPRLKQFKEHVNDHQLSTAKRFEQLGHVLAVYDTSDLPKNVLLLKSFRPAPRVIQTELVAQRIGDFLNNLK